MTLQNRHHVGSSTCSPVLVLPHPYYRAADAKQLFIRSDDNLHNRVFFWNNIQFGVNAVTPSVTTTHSTVTSGIGLASVCVTAVVDIRGIGPFG